MTGFPAVMLGGPQDGNRHVLKNDEMVVKFAFMVAPAKVTDEYEPDSPIGMDYIQYLRTKQFDSAGHRIYRFVPNATK